MQTAFNEFRLKEKFRDWISPELDAWLTNRFKTDIETSASCLVATGSYGLRQMCPKSDLDLILLYPKKVQPRVLAESIWYPIWDSGRKLDHSVKTVDEAISVAREDIKAALALLTLRPVVGNTKLADNLIRKAVKLWQDEFKEFGEKLSSLIDKRKTQFGSLAFAFEPNIKESYGGLRDLNTLVTLAQVLDRDLPCNLEEIKFLLLTVRSKLHEAGITPVDKLVFQEQANIANQLGFESASDLLSATASAGRVVGMELELLIEEQMIKRSKSRFRSSRPVILENGLMLNDKTVFFNSCLEKDSVSIAKLILTGTNLAVDNGFRLDEASLRLASQNAFTQYDKDTFNEFLKLIGSKGNLKYIELLDYVGFWEKLIPEWSLVKFKPQRNPYHDFNVDRHLLMTVTYANEYKRFVSRPDLLTLGALLHDIGKGLEGDHNAKGALLVKQIGKRMNLNSSDILVLEKLVLNHLLLADTATKRDLDDDRVISKVAEKCGDETFLELLYYLTIADSKATSKQAWGTFKEQLVSQLFHKLRNRLRNHVEQPLNNTLDISVDNLAELPLFKVFNDRLYFISEDEPYLLSKICGAIAIAGLNILRLRSYKVTSTENVNLIADEIVLGSEIDEPSIAKLNRIYRRVAEGTLNVEVELQKISINFLSVGSIKKPLSDPVVLANFNDSDTSVLIELRSPDERGLLFKVSKVLAEYKLDISLVLASTMGHEVVDVFYLTELDGTKPTQQKVERVIEKLTSTLQTN